MDSGSVPAEVMPLKRVLLWFERVTLVSEPDTSQLLLFNPEVPPQPFVLYLEITLSLKGDTLSKKSVLGESLFTTCA